MSRTTVQRMIIIVECNENYSKYKLVTHEGGWVVSVVEQRPGFLELTNEGRESLGNWKVNKLGFRKGTIYLLKQRAESFDV